MLYSFFCLFFSYGPTPSPMSGGMPGPMQNAGHGSGGDFQQHNALSAAALVAAAATATATATASVVALQERQQPTTNQYGQVSIKSLPSSIFFNCLFSI